MSTPAELLKTAEEARAAAAAALAKADAAIAAIQKGAVAGGGAVAAVTGAVDPVVFQFAIFVMAIFVGYYVVWSVTPALHTPLMSVTNAISSVIVVGAVLAVGVNVAGGGMANSFGFVALILAAVNIFGGFLVTNRMLAMYKKKD
jgi:H+-translocating NAD(P) transhydrogenase subunit alpha